ncbi:MAG: DNA methyltransferase, partial [Candidatus Bathyarchaeia archaeon]
FSEIKRVLRKTGSLYLNLGDTYVMKNLQMIPARVAIALQKQGWILRNDVIWHKTNGLPSSVKDRLTNRYEHLFHLVKNPQYYYNLDVIREPYKPSSFERFRGIVNQGFIRKDSKYIPLNLPPHQQFSQGKIPSPNWLKHLTPAPAKVSANNLKKVQRLYKLSKERQGTAIMPGELTWAS